MAEGLGRERGGILGLLDVVADHREAIEYELLDRGYGLEDLGTLTLSWRDFLVLVRRWQRIPHNALANALAGHDTWTVEEQLLAHVFDVNAMGNYIALKAGGSKTAKKPTPLTRPWDKKPQSFGKGAIPVDEFDDWIASTIREE